MAWIRPEVTDKCKGNIGPFIVIPEQGEILENVSVSIARAAIISAAGQKGSTLTTRMVAAISAMVKKGSALITGMVAAPEEDIFSSEDARRIRSMIRDRGRISIDCIRGRCVKLELLVIKGQISIDPNIWMDRPSLRSATPSEAVESLEAVVYEASVEGGG